MSNEAYTMAGAVVLLGIWLFMELHLEYRARPPLRGKTHVVSIELDEEERAQLKSVLCGGVRSPKSEFPHLGNWAADDPMERRALVEKVLRQID